MRTILVGAALVALAASASAQDKRPDYGTAIEAAAAKKIAAGALAECQKNGWNVAVAVVDTHGFLVYFERMENTQTASVDIAIGKAKAAATYRRTTRVFMDAINKGGPATATLPGVFASPFARPYCARIRALPSSSLETKRKRSERRDASVDRAAASASRMRVKRPRRS